MPEDMRGVIFYCTRDGIQGGWYDKKQQAFLSGSGACGSSQQTVTHYIPFPDIPIDE